MRKSWFRGKDVFTDRLNHYERLLANQPEVSLDLNAGNMIYIMMQRLEMGVDWDGQAALISSYRDLMYKLSYVSVMWRRKDVNYIHMDGTRGDIMWALSFITQVFPENSLECWTVVSDAEHFDGVKPVRFDIQNGRYSGDDREIANMINGIMPDIWAMDIRVVTDEQGHALPDYDATHAPDSGDVIILPDHRQAYYVKMNDRYRLADSLGKNVDVMTRHNISASFIKDFNDLLWAQTSMDYDVYRMRYIALMSKVHELENMLKGLEASCYDMLPIGERGLPYAPEATIKRTNEMDSGSLQYVLDKLEANRDNLNDREKKDMMQEAARSVVARVAGYDTEFRTYRLTESNEDVCGNIRGDKCTALYHDFAILDSYGVLRFPPKVYQVLCNDPEHTVYEMTSFEREKLRLFGRGYFNFLEYSINNAQDERHRRIWISAMNNLQQRYLQRK